MGPVEGPQWRGEVVISRAALRVNGRQIDGSKVDYASCAEMLGLPGTGKTTIVERVAERVGAVPVRIEWGFHLSKAWNVVWGWAALRGCWIDLLALGLRMRGDGVRGAGAILRLMERVGRRERFGKCPNRQLVDEGVVQACWGVAFQGGQKDARREIVLRMVRRLADPGCLVYYLSVEKGEHLSRLREREGSFAWLAEDLGRYAQARGDMADVLRSLRAAGGRPIPVSGIGKDVGASPPLKEPCL